MDAVHMPETRKWISKEAIDVGSYFEEYHRLVVRPSSTHNVNTKIVADARDRDETRTLMKLMGAEDSLDHNNKDYCSLNTDMLKGIEKMCHVDQLSVPSELVPMVASTECDPSGERFRCLPIPSHGIRTLKTLQYQQQWLENATKDDKYKRGKFCRYPNIHWFESAPKRCDRVNTLMIEKEVVLTVRIYRPFKAMSRQVSSFSSLKFNQEFLVLGDNRLSDLRDHIVCNVDFFVPGNVAENPFKGGKVTRCKDIYKSGFFFIEDTFYNDMRYPEAIDYSETIREWATKKRRKLGEFFTAKMEDTCFKDLKIRLGYPYVYVHQGDHEHLMIFTDARLHSADDPQRLNEFPLERSVGVRHSKYCLVCQINIAKWVTKDSDRVPEDPFLWCQECFKSFNYDDSNAPIGTFKAFPYVDINAV